MSDISSEDTAVEQLAKAGMLPNDPGDLDREFASKELSDLLEIVDRDIVGWNPKPGDKLYGEVVDISEGTGDYGDYPLLTIETPSGRLIGAHCFHTILKREIQKKMQSGLLQIGSQIAIAYRGEITSGSGKQPANMYRVAVRPPKQ